MILKIIYGSKFLQASELVFKYGIFMTFISLITLQIFYFISISKYWYLIHLSLILVGQISSIWMLHNNLDNVLNILIVSSAALFILNMILIIIFSKKIRHGLTAGQDFSIDSGNSPKNKRSLHHLVQKD